ncbi:zinc finger protein 709-like [Phlebotomus argentipes]|uniref:zinc finger protein 709-like n=1 Tax=Phlebotomus argentipes TaxID=94469 RepID=UPI002892D39E|nr:zinc finger protein 709-like [Phlebotomus argentipes]
MDPCIPHPIKIEPPDSPEITAENDESILGDVQPDFSSVALEIKAEEYLEEENSPSSSKSRGKRDRKKKKWKREKTGLTYSCAVCEKKFQYMASLRIHMRFHSGENLRQCSQCGKRYATQYALKRHSRTHKQTKPSVCKICSATFADPNDFRRHKRFHATGEPAYACKECDETFDTYNAIKLHRSKRHKKSWHCRHCWETFLTDKEYQEHRVVHEHPVCPKCHVKFMTQELLEMHMAEAADHESLPKTASPVGAAKDSAGATVYDCDLCPKRFSRRDNLLEHRRLHTGVGLVSCEYCPMKFTTHARFRKHVVKHTERKTFPCPHCEKEFASQHYLGIHLLTHSEDQLPYPCELCSKAFSRSNALRNHMYSHMKQFPCSKCALVFPSDRQLKRHRRMHKLMCSRCGTSFETMELVHMHFEEYHPGEEAQILREQEPGQGEIEEVSLHQDGNDLSQAIGVQKVHSCEFCGKEFNHKSHLVSHRNTHTKIFKCSKCPEVCASERQLKKHRLIHKFPKEATSDEILETKPNVKQLQEESKSYSCKFCEKEFAKPSALGIHVKTHLKSLSCPKCSAIFPSARQLQNHVRDNHTTEDDEDSEEVEEDEEEEEMPDLHDGDSSEDSDKVIIKKEPLDEPEFWPCDICGKGFSRSRSLHIHIKSHSEFPCRKCSQICYSERELKKHRKVHKTTCKVCRMEFETADLLKLHYQECHPEDRRAKRKVQPAEVFQDPLMLTENDFLDPLVD